MVGCLSKISSWSIGVDESKGASSFVVIIRFPEYSGICSGKSESYEIFNAWRDFENL